jgi:hypothetical protein
MVCSYNNTLREIGYAGPRRHWTKVMGMGIAQLQAHLEAQFTEGMTWDKFLAGEIQIDHVIPQSWFPYGHPDDLAFKDCWSLGNLQPLWAFDNKSKGARRAVI